MTDGELILQLTKAITEDPERPTIEQRFDPFDPVAVTLVLYEVDAAIDKYMEKYASYREQFSDPVAFDKFVLTCQQKARMDIKWLISEAQELIIENEQESDEEGDEDI